MQKVEIEEVTVSTGIHVLDWKEIITANIFYPAK